MKKISILLIIAFCITVFSGFVYAEEDEGQLMTTTVQTVSNRGEIPISIDLSTIDAENYKVIVSTNMAMSCYFEVPYAFNGLTTTFIPDGSYDRIVGYYIVGASTIEQQVTITLEIYDADENLIKQEMIALQIVPEQSGNNPGGDFSGGAGSGSTAGGASGSGFSGMTTGFSGVSGMSTASVVNTNEVYYGSPDNYLKSLSVEGYELSPNFNTTNSTYFITVGNDVEKINVTCKTNSSSASYTIYGTKNLEEGMNKVLITVTAENGKARTYRIYVTKEAIANEKE